MDAVKRVRQSKRITKFGQLRTLTVFNHEIELSTKTFVALVSP